MKNEVALIVILIASFMSVAIAQSYCQLKFVGTYETFAYDEDASEKVAYDAISQSVAISNANEGVLDIVDITDPTDPKLTIKLDPSTDVKNSFPNFVPDAVEAVEVAGNLIFAAVTSDIREETGYIAIYSAADYSFVGAVPTNSEPDALSVSADGNTIVGISQGGDESVGSLTVITLDPLVCAPFCIDYFKSGGVGFISTAPNIPVPNFGTAEELRAKGIRIADENIASAIQLQPESAAVSADGKLAFVNFQENNAVAAYDTVNGEWLWIDAYGEEVMTMDASDSDSKIDMRSDWFGVTVKGLHQPDEIVVFEVDGNMFMATANEGAGDDIRLGDVGTTCANDSILSRDEYLGRLAVPNSFPTRFSLFSGKILCDSIYTLSSRSFSIFKVESTGIKKIYDSGSFMEKLISETNPDFFNSTDDANEFDSRSDAKGLEPEGLTIATLPDGRILAFISSERISGVFVYDISDPYNPVFQDYINRRNFGDVNIEDQVDSGSFTYNSLDVGSENFAYVAPEVSPICAPMLIVANPISGTTSNYVIDCSATELRNGDGHCESSAQCQALYPELSLSDIDQC